MEARRQQDDIVLKETLNQEFVSGKTTIQK